MEGRKAEILDLISNKNSKYYPIHEIIKVSDAKVFNVAFSMTNDKKKKLNLKDCEESINKEDEIDIAGSELYLGYEEYADYFMFKIFYDINLFKEYQIEELIKSYKYLLGRLVSEPDKSIKQIGLLEKAEYRKIVHEWNATDKSYPHDKTIHALFEEQVLKTPDNIAVVYDNRRLSYRELNERSNQLAHYLIRYHNIKPDVLVGLPIG